MFRRTLSVGRHGRPHWTLLGSSPNRSRQRGFSVVELMMSVLLMAIGAALALPSYRDMVEKRQVTNGAEQVAAFVNSAQGVAMKTNRFVKVSWDHVDGDEWCLGATVVADVDDDPCDCTGADASAPACAIDGAPFVLNQSHAGDRDLMHDMGSEDTGSYTFDPIRGFSPDLNGELTVAMRSVTGDFRLNLVVNQTGRVILCSEDADHAIPGYAICDVPEIIADPGGPDPITVDPKDPIIPGTDPVL